VGCVWRGVGVGGDGQGVWAWVSGGVGVGVCGGGEVGGGGVWYVGLKVTSERLCM